MGKEILDTHQKALAVNLDLSNYGTIAEIGAGQETARWFFRAGGAAGTIAKAMSAYDMKVSDAIYGGASRYVSRERLQSMLDTEYSLVLERLNESRGDRSNFFAFANTVAARSYTHKTDGHGWLGIRFQAKPHEEPSNIVLHVSLSGKNNVRDQETLGVLGVNLIYGALHMHHDSEKLLKSLMDQLFPEVLSIDLIDFDGPAFTNVDNRLMALRLIQYDLSSATMFLANGQVTQVSDALWKKAVLIERSRFRPPTKLTVELQDRAQAAFLQDTGIDPEQMLVLSEMTLNDLSDTDSGEIDAQDFLNRSDILCALGKNVLISNYGEYYRLAQYVFRYTNMPVAVAMGLPSLRQIFTEEYYEALPGGILESFGRMFKHDLRLYVCPELDSKTGKVTGINQLKVAKNLQHLFDYLIENNYVKPLDGITKEYLSIYSHDVLKKIHSDEAGWEDMVHDEVVDIIKQRGLFNWNQNNEKNTI